MLYLAKVSNSIRYLEYRLEEIYEKVGIIDAVAGRVEGLPIQELLARVDTLEANTNVRRTVNYERGDSLSGFITHMEERVSELDSSQKTLLEMINDMSEDFRATLDVRNEIADVKVPELRPFCRVRDAKALENFIFDLEQYFKATNTVIEEAKVTLTTMYLCEDAKLWWRSRYMDIQEGRCSIDTWDVLKKELRSLFFPENVEILARRKLCDLKHTGKIREYVKQFAGLMLDICDMSEKDKVFCFVEGLKPWARAKLYEQRVQDLTNSRPSSPKAVMGDECPSKDRRSHQSSIENTW
ncbi:uncharacterized protein E6C27_scaffold103G00290 [Cucumis melo var. makuwa]|uniref:Retrotransposon gag domain-containing protein n=1 Tax=Cucumis melo var. makuwa TaxID=1194695 RepID=A0A5A7SZW7_CUCMM|nr:uncharacterized protein E6C27_scaffold103G00290 [Cucumis melo var. makuwa]